MNTVIKYASGKPSDPLRGYSYVHDLNLRQPPPNRGHDAQNAVGYNYASVKPSIFNCNWKSPRIFLHIRYKLTPNDSNLTLKSTQQQSSPQSPKPYSLSHALYAKARKSFHGVLLCLVMMHHQTNCDCKSFSISEDLIEMVVALTLNIVK